MFFYHTAKTKARRGGEKWGEAVQSNSSYRRIIKRMSKNHIVHIITDSHSQICPKQFCKVVKYRYNYGNMSFLNQSIKL